MAADGFEPPKHHGQQIVEVMRDPSGQLADGFDLLGLAERLLRLLPRSVLGLQFARPLLDPFLQRFGEGAELDDRPLLLGHVGIDADHTKRPPLAIEQDDVACLDPPQRTVCRAGNTKIDVEFARARVKSTLNQFRNPYLVLAEDRGPPVS